jgi:hypothetical protein
MHPEPDDMRALLRRMDLLERRSKRLFALMVVVALLCAAILTWQFMPLDSTIDARGFILRDSNWQARAELKVRRDNSPVLRLNNRGGTAAAMLAVRDDGAVALRLYDTTEQERAEVRLDEHGIPAFTLTGANGRSRMTLTAEETDQPGGETIVLRDRMGRRVWSAPPGEGSGGGR